MSSSEEEYNEASAADDNSSDGSVSDASAADDNPRRQNAGRSAIRLMEGDNAKSLIYITITNVTLGDYKGLFDRNVCRQVGVHHLPPAPPGATIAQQRTHRDTAVELMWASYSHQRDKDGLFKKNKKKRGTIHMTCLFFKRNLTVEGVRWWLINHVLQNIEYVNVDVTWAGPQGERDIVASGTTIRQNNPPLPLGLRNRAITVQRNIVAQRGDSGTFLETDGRNVASRARGGYLHLRTNGSAFPRDELAVPTNFPILTPAQFARANDPTRGFPSYQAYRHWVVNNQPRYNDLMQHEYQEIIASASGSNITREEIDNRKHIALLAIEWHRDMGEHGCLLEVTATTRRENNRVDGVQTWGGMEVYSGAAVGRPDINIGSGIARWTELRNAGVAYTHMDPPTDDPQSDARYLVESLKHVRSDLQEEFAPGCAHMVISLEPNKRRDGDRTDSHACLLTIVRSKNRDTFRITRKLNYLLWYYGLMPKAVPIENKYPRLLTSFNARPLHIETKTEIRFVIKHFLQGLSGMFLSDPVGSSQWVVPKYNIPLFSR